MTDFEDHCWRDVMPAELLANYSAYHREVFIGPAPALLVIDLYEMVYQGGARPVSEDSSGDQAQIDADGTRALRHQARIPAAARRYLDHQAARKRIFRNAAHRASAPT
jgi:maleamate amidohydrolase